MTVNNPLDWRANIRRERRRRAQEVLAMIRSGEEFGTRQVADMLGVTMSTAYRLCRSFRAAGWIEVIGLVPRNKAHIFRGTAPQRHGEGRETAKPVSGAPSSTEAELPTSGPQEADGERVAAE